MSKMRQQEVVSARTRLDATLQNLVDLKEESHAPSEAATISVLDMRASPSPKKLTPKANRKRKRREESEDYDGDEEQRSVVMKLFDRSVDLAKFPEDSSLYPVCRAWIHNRPQDKTLGTLPPRPPSPKEEPSSDPACITSLPPPIKSEEGCLYDLRVPAPMAQPDETLDIHQAPSLAPQPEHLLLQHMARWKDVRHSWHKSSAMNEMQYASSLQVLKEMYDKSMGEAV